MLKLFVRKKNRKRNFIQHYFYPRKSTFGFTLVELLVVVAIIGLLVSIGLVYLQKVQDKARNAGIQAALFEIRNVAELFYSDNEPNTYKGVCHPDDGTLSDEGSFGIIEGNIVFSGGDVTCRDSDTAYAVISSLNRENCWCVDSAGASKEVILESGTCAEKLTTTVCP